MVAIRVPGPMRAPSSTCRSIARPARRATISATGSPAITPCARLTTVAEGLAPLLKSLGLDDRIREESILQSWKEIVGEFIAQHSQPCSLRGGVLLVQVLQPTMHYELDRVWKVKILQKLKEQYGAKAVSEIRFKIG